MIFRLADISDDAQLRELMRETVIPGHIRMIYSREPSFFDSIRIIGDNTQVIVADDDGQIVGVGCRSIRNLYINGQSQPVGYLSGLRLSSTVQNGIVLARGYSYLKQLHADNKTPAYITTIIHGNDRAREILTSKRAALPSYIPMGSYLTHVCPVRKDSARHSPQDQLKILPATRVATEQLSAFLAREGARRQFFPVHEFNGHASSTLDSIKLENVLVAKKHDEIVGTMAVWDQGKHKQHVIAGYSPLFRITRPFLNLGLRLKGRHTLPPSGQQLRYGTAALICIRDDDTDVFRALLQSALSRASSSGLHQLAVGMHQRDPFVSVLKSFYHILYRSWLYLVCWEDDSFYRSLDNSLVPYLELGAL